MANLFKEAKEDQPVTKVKRRFRLNDRPTPRKSSQIEQPLLPKESIEITISLHCDNCPHGDHSGAFTPGGAKPVCGHSGCGGRKVIPHQRINTFLGPKTGYDISKVPTWCPMRNAKTLK